MSSGKTLHEILSVKHLISKLNIQIPDYQRPYKWTLKNVDQLIDDIMLYSQKSSYRIGTIVFHRDKNGKLNIVDG